MHVGHGGGGIPRTSVGHRQMIKPSVVNFEHRPSGNFCGSLTRSKAGIIDQAYFLSPPEGDKAYFGSAPPGSYEHYQYNLTDHQRGNCTLRGIRRRLVLKMEGLARVSEHAERKTTSSDRGVSWRVYGLSSMIGMGR